MMPFIGFYKLIVQGILKIIITQKSLLEKPKILEILVSHGITPEQAQAMDKDTIIAAIKSKQANTELVIEKLLLPEMSYWEKTKGILLLILVLVVIIVPFYLLKQTPDRSRILTGTILYHGAPLKDVEVQMIDYKKIEHTNSRGAFVISLDELKEKSDSFRLRFIYDGSILNENFHGDTSTTWFVNQNLQIELNLDKTLIAVTNHGDKPKPPKQPNKKATLAADAIGHVMYKNNTAVIGAAIFYQNKKIAQTDNNGFFSFQLPDVPSNDLSIIVVFGNQQVEETIGRIQKDKKIIL